MHTGILHRVIVRLDLFFVVAAPFDLYMWSTFTWAMTVADETNYLRRPDLSHLSLRYRHMIRYKYHLWRFFWLWAIFISRCDKYVAILAQSCTTHTCLIFVTKCTNSGQLSIISQFAAWLCSHSLCRLFVRVYRKKYHTLHDWIFSW